MAPRLGLGNTLAHSPRVGNFLLDKYGDGVYGAYSLRQLRTGVTRVCQAVKSSDEGNPRDFTAAELVDGTTLDAFGSGSSVRVTKLYDQSGNGNDAFQTTVSACPKIYSLGELVDGNGLPWMDFDGTDDFIPLHDALPDIDIGNLSSFVVGKFDTTAGLGSGEYMFTLGTPYADSGIGTTIHKRWYAPAALNPAKFNWGYADDFDIHQESMDTNVHMFTTIAGTIQGNWQPFVDGISLTSKTRHANDSGYVYGLGGVNANNAFSLNGKIQEAIVYRADKSPTRTLIEGDIMSYYGL